jgi:hypothetical protein
MNLINNSKIYLLINTFKNKLFIHIFYNPILIHIIITITYILLYIYLAEPTLCQDAVGKANDTPNVYMSPEEIGALFASLEQREQDLIQLANTLASEKVNFYKSVAEHNDLVRQAKNQVIGEHNELNREKLEHIYNEANNKFNEAKLNLSKYRGVETKIRIIKPYFKSGIEKVSFETY